ncbi:MAG: GNAT family N-acetyltransferase [Saprospiraceae bacterium]|nr:GNAT family N-acetyltransferase [Saprospiraceae bacterium]
MQNITFQRIEEFALDQQQKSEIHQLLKENFSGYPKDRIFYKQLPNFRFIASCQEEIIGHMAVDYRVMNNDGQLVSIFGVIDLCVKEAFQHQRIASQLLHQLAELGKDHKVDFIVLNAVDPHLYQNNGFEVVRNECKWMVIHQQSTLGVVKRSLQESLMIKSLGSKEWRPKQLDFLGPIF